MFFSSFDYHLPTSKTQTNHYSSVSRHFVYLAKNRLTECPGNAWGATLGFHDGVDVDVV